MMKLIISCEHATNLIPQEYQHLFSNAENTLESHRGYDPGTLDLFFHLEKLADFSRFYEWSRLLVEPNRSLHHKNLFSKYTKGSSQKVKNQLIQEYYLPYRNQIERNILESIEKGEKLLHLSLHSFTPELDGEIRNTEIGLLFDSTNEREKLFCIGFKSAINQQYPNLRIRFNYPYLGKADGFTTYLRRKFPENYLGIELEVNQIFSNQNKMNFEIKEAIYQALEKILKN